jgi:hypothetical protein
MAFISLDSPSCEVPCLILHSVVYRDVTRQAKVLYRLKHEVALKRGLAYLSRYNSSWFCHTFAPVLPRRKSFRAVQPPRAGVRAPAVAPAPAHRRQSLLLALLCSCVVPLTRQRCARTARATAVHLRQLLLRPPVQLSSAANATRSRALASARLLHARTCSSLRLSHAPAPSPRAHPLAPHPSLLRSLPGSLARACACPSACSARAAFAPCCRAPALRLCQPTAHFHSLGLRPSAARARSPGPAPPGACLPARAPARHSRCLRAEPPLASGSRGPLPEPRRRPPGATHAAGSRACPAPSRAAAPPACCCRELLLLAEERKGKSRERKKMQPPVKDKVEQREEKQRRKGTRIFQELIRKIRELQGPVCKTKFSIDLKPK